MALSDEQLLWFAWYVDNYELDINEQIEEGKIASDEIEIAKQEIETFKEIKNFLYEDRKIRKFDGWETTLTEMPIH